MAAADEFQPGVLGCCDLHPLPSMIDGGVPQALGHGKKKVGAEIVRLKGQARGQGELVAVSSRVSARSAGGCHCAGRESERDDPAIDPEPAESAI